LVHVDAPETTKDYSDRIEQCGARVVPSLGLITTMDWPGDGTCTIRARVTNGFPANSSPDLPSAPLGDDFCLLDSSYSFVASTSDFDGDELLYQWDWGDGDSSGWVGPFGSGENCLVWHSWSAYDTCEVRVRAVDSWSDTTAWSPPLTVIVGADCCQLPGDVDDSESGPDISDLVYLVDFMFTGGPEPPCEAQGNIDGVPGIDISDLVYLVDFMFTSGPPPPDCP